jgi:hypothetical protein
MRSEQVNARVSPERKRRYRTLASVLGVSLSDLIVELLDAAAGIVQRQGWECRTVHLLDGRVVQVGEETPLAGGVPLPTAGYTIFAPRDFWEVLDRAVGATRRAS